MNTRIDELRRRLEREPESRLFAQLAEELRRAGELAEAIRVARDGLARHQNYSSARITLGRALMDSGDYAAAATEFAEVVKAAPENLIASRSLAECLEKMGDLSGALAWQKETLRQAPGDAGCVAKIAELSARVETAATMKMEVAAHEQTLDETLPGGDEAPIPLVSADESFEFERPSAETPASTGGFYGGLEEGELEQGERPIFTAAKYEQGSDSATVDAMPVEAPPEDVMAEEAPASAELLEAPGSQNQDELASPTLAELYFRQGAAERAIEIYRQLLVREPGKDAYRYRIKEIDGVLKWEKAAEGAAGGEGEPRGVGAGGDDRRERLARTIAKLERLLAATVRG